MNNVEALDQEFGLIADLVKLTARDLPDQTNFILDGRKQTYAETAELMDRVAAALQRDGVQQREAISVCASTSIEYATLFLGALSIGVVTAPLAPSSTSEQLEGMIKDSGAKLLFLDATTADSLKNAGDAATIRISLDGSDCGKPFAQWLAPKGAKPVPAKIDPQDPFNIIYSSGTTGIPKGIVQSHKMRWAHVQRANAFGYDRTALTLLSTPLYSNTTLVSFFPTLAGGGTVALMKKFDAHKFLELASSLHATHAMLVPVQYHRIMSQPDFDSFDLSTFRCKFCTSAPFAGTLKSDILKRWPGGLVEYYGMTEGGGSCVLLAHEFPDKVDTVGRPAENCEIKLIDENGVEVATGEVGEIVGHSPTVMNGYHNQPGKTREAQWVAPDGRIFIKTGDVGRFDAEGFLKLMDRRKDMIISGGFNIYPSDLEAILVKHPAVQECAVVGVKSVEWGETPLAFAVLRAGAKASPEELREFANSKLGKTQRISRVEIVDALPRSAIGKILKRELRDEYEAKRAL
ncbi:MAG: acyl--CoA ligase [Hyphomicrobiales bacterium]|nr:acyl--CoA ligase [Hyphomicrobiales bacterium]